MVRSALDQGAVSTLILSEAINKMRITWKCKECSNQWELTQSKTDAVPNCPECDSSSIVEDKDESMDLIDELTILAGHISADVRLVSLDTEEGATLNNSFGGIAALLRYSIV